MTEEIKWVKCPECGNAVAKTSTQCPTCAKDVSAHYKAEEREKLEGTLGCLALIVVAIASSFAFHFIDSLVYEPFRCFTGLNGVISFIILTLIYVLICYLALLFSPEDDEDRVLSVVENIRKYFALLVCLILVLITLLYIFGVFGIILRSLLESVS